MTTQEEVDCVDYHFNNFFKSFFKTQVVYLNLSDTRNTTSNDYKEYKL